MSSLGPFIQPPETEDDDPIIHPSLQRYIHGLPDSHTNYARFFSALLIPQQSHEQFFVDLKQFREQAIIIYLLAPGTSENYRAVSKNFVGSRFAHPWCRVQSDFGKGWRAASWSGTSGAKIDERVRKEEEQLHKLLVPIWIAMRRRMFPGEEVVKEWIEKEDERERSAAGEEEKRKKSKAETAESSKSLPPASSSGVPPSEPPPAYAELGFATKSTKPSTTHSDKTDPSRAAAASKLFLGVAVTGFIMSDRRIQKYVEKKLLKK
ncbi:uncharacterized protein Z520_00039 [Fonsecaea multimorphosa CBS 102226]|uniref:Uncharacterized protein n=1 Tax=Fonsecaea multimorphosa CBS 102226 TaxID=1442371 RepID=A0A0D2KBD3_9EURO|nr:uncharacterized protein Z520_00039 [Fonsecaea multimorphosa CBS 102226]KIY03348.1 hypothetical protein Z520_00039 [Fonsecaea multimorphosa CBS 102226]OAL32999.1 hypothetical protein AYO22_00084 [Fonsecaea multimorphosa]